MYQITTNTDLLTALHNLTAFAMASVETAPRVTATPDQRTLCIRAAIALAAALARGPQTYRHLTNAVDALAALESEAVVIDGDNFTGSVSDVSGYTHDVFRNLGTMLGRDAEDVLAEFVAGEWTVGTNAGHEIASYIEGLSVDGGAC